MKTFSILIICRVITLITMGIHVDAGDAADGGDREEFDTVSRILCGIDPSLANLAAQFYEFGVTRYEDFGDVELEDLKTIGVDDVLRDIFMKWHGGHGNGEDWEESGRRYRALRRQAKAATKLQAFARGRKARAKAARKADQVANIRRILEEIERNLGRHAEDFLRAFSGGPQDFDLDFEGFQDEDEGNLARIQQFLEQPSDDDRDNITHFARLFANHVLLRRPTQRRTRAVSRLGAL